MKHVIIYVPGLGDTSITTRRLLVSGWWMYGVRPVVHQMNWADGKPFAGKLDSLLSHIDTLVAKGRTVSLVGESAGASAAVNAYAARQSTVHRVACICGKLNRPNSVGSSTYGRSPAFGQSMDMLSASLDVLPAEKRRRIRSVHPLSDQSVPIADTYIAEADMQTIPTHGHAVSIALGDTLFSWRLIGFLKRR